MEHIPTIPFEQMPTALYRFGQKLDELTELVQSLSSHKHPAHDQWFGLTELCEYLPDKPAPTTVYGLVQRREIPFGRRGKKLIFLKADIDLWLASKSTKTNQQIKEIADTYINTKTSAVRRRKGDAAV